MNTIQKETFRAQSDRSVMIRANIKRFYIYAVLVLIVFVFSMMKLDQVSRIYIGVGNRRTPVSNGVGRIYIDDIRLYPRTP